MAIKDRGPISSSLSSLVTALSQQAKTSRYFKNDCRVLVDSVECFKELSAPEDKKASHEYQTAFKEARDCLLQCKALIERCNSSQFLRGAWFAYDLQERFEGCSEHLQKVLQMLIQVKHPGCRSGKSPVQASLVAALDNVRGYSFHDCKAMAKLGVQIKKKLVFALEDEEEYDELLELILESGPSSKDAVHEELVALRQELDQARSNGRKQEVKFLEPLEQLMEMTRKEKAPASTCSDLMEFVMPEEVLCPITREMLKDPVMLVETGQSYERSAIENWLGLGNMTDPVTGKTISCSTVVPNHTLRKLVAELIRAHPTWSIRGSSSLPSSSSGDSRELLEPEVMTLEQVERILDLLAFPVEKVKCNDKELRARYWTGSLIFRAAVHNRTDLAEVLISYEVGEIHSALCWAAMGNAVEVLEFLLSHGANVEHKFIHNTVSGFSEEVKKRVGVSQTFLDKQSEIPSENMPDATALHLAALNNSADVAKILLEKGADVNALNVHEATPLHLAILNNSVEVTKMLLDAGAHPDVRNRAGLTPVQLASKRVTPRMAQVLSQHGLAVKVAV